MSELNGLDCPCGLHKGCFSVNPDNGWGKCFSGSCLEGGKKHNFPPGTFDIPGVTLPEVTEQDEEPRKKNSSKSEFTSLSTHFRAYPQRGLSEDTIKQYKVDVGGPNAKYEAKYPLFSLEGYHVGNKVRYPEKKFVHEGSSKGLGLFGRHVFGPGSAKAITVTEGQDDAMAVFEMFGGRYPAVSVHSSSTAERDIRANFDYLDSFEKIVFCFDNDEAGRAAVKIAADIGFPIGKVFVCSLRRHKDANEYLLAGEREEFSREWWGASEHRPDGLVLGSELWDEIINWKHDYSVPWPWEGLNKKTYGLRLSEMVIVTAETKVGKTTLLKMLEHSLLTNPELIAQNIGVGFLHFEEPKRLTALGLLSIENGVPYHLPDRERPEEDLRRAFDKVLNNNRVVLFDHFGSNSIDTVLDKVRHMAAMGAKYIVLDHLSIIVSDHADDERKKLDEIATKLKTMTMQLEISVIAVIHVNRQGLIKGSSAVEQLGNIVIRLSRNKLDADPWRRNVTTVTVTENRFSGDSGVACYLWYNPETGLQTELDDIESALFEQGGRTTPDETWE